MQSISRMHLLFATIATLSLSAGFAHASRGPGTTPGTASPLMQIMMAIVVYGSCAAVIAAGAIGMLRKS